MENKIDTSVPHSARTWNYWLGGKDNYPVDQDLQGQPRRHHAAVGTTPAVQHAPSPASHSENRYSLLTTQS
ncbi:SAM-dependent methyltransferase [Streptomyces sp. GC420]|uniref:SAM-dependent methyltransferase n=1 Tax=Streptomyces sp. GC420 TaxID=2697568 RepID=UPI0028BDC7F1|nr:SAM-dependent methyltransferase [Streptomyces sp. GC420]